MERRRDQITFSEVEEVDIAELRNFFSLTQKQMALAVGVTERTIQNWEKHLPLIAVRRVRDLIELHSVLCEYIAPDEIGPWLRYPNDALQRRTPLDLIIDGRAQEILAKFSAIQVQADL